MADTGDSKLGSALLIAIGGLWLALTGLCTQSFSGEHQYGTLWPIGLWFMCIGVLPLAIGLRAFVPPRGLGWTLGVAGAAWLICGVLWVAGALINEARSSAVDVNAVTFAFVVWAIYQAPGAGMLLGGVSILRGARKAFSPTLEKTFD